MTSREMLEDVVERLTEQLKVANASLKSMSDEFRQALEKLETLEKEHKRVVHQVGELKKKESKLVSERDKARESAKKSLEKISEMESKQSAKSARVKPENFRVAATTRTSRRFWISLVCAKVNNWNEEEKANQLILCMKEKARVVMSQLSSEDKSSYERMVKLYAKRAECVRSLKLPKLRSRLDEERWEKIC